jgi:hypothetical protein
LFAAFLLAAVASLVIAGAAKGGMFPPAAPHTVTADAFVPAITVSSPGSTLLTVTVDGEPHSVEVPANSLTLGGTLHVEALTGGGAIADPVVSPCTSPDNGASITLAGVSGGASLKATFTPAGQSEPAATLEVPVPGSSRGLTASVCAH